MKHYILEACLDIARDNLERHPVFNIDASNYYMHWSFIVHRNRLIKWGINRSGTPPIYLGHSRRINLNKAKIHSELDAWRKSKFVLNDRPFECVNIRLNRRGELRLSKPCICCDTFLKIVGCTNVVYSTCEGFNESSRD